MKITAKLRAKYLGVEEKEGLYRQLHRDSGLHEKRIELMHEIERECLSIIESNFPAEIKKNYSARVMKKYGCFYINPTIFGIKKSRYPSDDIPRKLGEEPLINANPVDFELAFRNQISVFDPVYISNYTDTLNWVPKELSIQQRDRVRDLILDYLEIKYKDSNFLSEYCSGPSCYSKPFLPNIKTWGKLYNTNEEWFNKLVELYRHKLSEDYFIEEEPDKDEIVKSEKEKLIDSLKDLRSSLRFS